MTESSVCVLHSAGVEVYICDFHREQCWLRWTALSKHGVANVRDELLELLRRTARAPDVEAFKEALQQLQSSRIWQKHAALQNWFEKTWLPHKEVCFCSSPHVAVYSGIMFTAKFVGSTVS